jgi:ubiquinone/menaquinone biosynthesis C-methylase UbiE
MATADPFRQQLHGMWASVAPAWADHAAAIDERSVELTASMLERAALHPGDRVLELACGPGGLGLAAAPLVVPGGEVVCSDVAAEMADIAAARAKEQGLGNVRTRVLDLEAIDEPDASFDVVLCREGLMFAVDPARAAREVQRVLRPEGRAVVAVWGPRDRNPWLGAALDAVGEQLGMPVPPPGVPGPFALEDADRLADVLADSGLTGVRVEEHPVEMRARSFDEWWGRTTALAGPVAGLLASLDATAAAQLRDRAQKAAAHYETPDGYTFPGVSLLATACR